VELVAGDCEHVNGNLFYVYDGLSGGLHRVRVYKPAAPLDRLGYIANGECYARLVVRPHDGD